MSTEVILAVVFRWAHILAAVVAVGGTIFMRLVLAPAVRASLTDDQHAALRQAVTARWKMVVMTCIAVLLASGVFNFFITSMEKAKSSALYHPLFGLRILAALGVFFIASALTGRAKAFEGMRAQAPKWMAVAAVLGVVVILISGLLKNLPAGG